MPVLPCPLGSRCTEGDDGATWKTVDIDFEQANRLVADHIKFTHSSISEYLNVNKGCEGGNFVNSSLNNPIFNIHTPAAAPPSLPIRQQESFGVFSDSSSAVNSREGSMRKSITIMPRRSKLRFKHWACCLIISTIFATFLIYILVILVDFILYHHIIEEVVEDEIEEKNRLSQIELTRQQ